MRQVLNSAIVAAKSETAEFAEVAINAQNEVEALRADAETKRGLLLWALYRAQGGSSPVGQPIRRHLGIEQHAHLTLDQIQDAARAAQGDKT